MGKARLLAGFENSQTSISSNVRRMNCWMPLALLLHSAARGV